DLQDYGRTLDKRSIADLLAEVARRYPDRYGEISKTIVDLGRKASYLRGETLTLSDMEPVFDRKKLYDRMDHEIETAKRQLGVGTDEFKRKRLQIWAKYADEMTNTTRDSALSKGTNLANTVISGARGNVSQLRGIVSSPAMYT